MKKLIRYLHIFYVWKIAQTTVNNYIPEDISIELTNMCNFRCSFCPQSDHDYQKNVSPSTLHPEKAQILLTKLRQGGVTTNLIHWSLNGEPFINKNIDKICSLAIDLGWINFIFATNGYFCTLEKIRALPIRRDVTYTLFIDFCSDTELFEKHRGNQGSWIKIKKNINNIITQTDLNNISIIITDISSFTITDPSELKNRLLELKKLFPASKRLQFTSRQYHNATGFIPGIFEKKRLKAKKYHLCPYPWTSLVIASNGDVVACCRDITRKTVLGNLFQEDLASIWNGVKYQQFRKALSQQKPQSMKACINCDLPYDESRFRLKYILKRSINRFGLFK